MQEITITSTGEIAIMPMQVNKQTSIQKNYNLVGAKNGERLKSDYFDLFLEKKAV